MNQEEFLTQWRAEKRMYEAWGHFVACRICASLPVKTGTEPERFLKMPVSIRVKEDYSLVDKAFHRGKRYSNPYQDIEDKVGARFVVMLVSDISVITGLIEEGVQQGMWLSDQCRSYIDERKQQPNLFTYQSDHFILRSIDSLYYGDVEISSGIPCEVQVRTLLQHAYAELTHDVIYKRHTLVRHDVQRTVAKTMAFIETADDFFKIVSDEVNESVSTEIFVNRIYEELTGEKPINQKSSLLIYDAFQQCINEDFRDRFTRFAASNRHLAAIICDNRKLDAFYSQGVVLFVYWLIKHRPRQLDSYWPLEWSLISDMAVDMGVALKRQV